MDSYFAAVRQVRGLAPGPFARYLETLFDGVDLRGKNVLDVGGGVGLYSFYAACRGARGVVCLEPGGRGARAGATRGFRELAALVDVEQVALHESTFQEFEADGRTFDVVLLHNSINHLDEDACIALRAEPAARATYERICAKLAELTRPGGRLIVADCSRHNLYALLGLRNPHAPTIEWNKHHAPRVWIDLLRGAGFAKPKVTWPDPYRLSGFRKALLDNPVASFFLSSHFHLRMERG